MFLLMIFTIMVSAEAPSSTPKILLIAREPVQRGAEVAYDRIESDTARLAMTLGCPHPYLAFKPLSAGKNEVWWINGFSSQREVELVGEAYKNNGPWSAALTKNQKLKKPLTGNIVEQFADHEPESDSESWAAGRVRFLVVAVNPATHLRGSNVFKARDGTRYEIMAKKTREEAEGTAREEDLVVLELVPRWSFPAREWVDAQPMLWNATR